MVKSTINLLIDKEVDTLWLHLLKTILPIASGISLIIFIVLYVISVYYSNNNIAQYNILKNEIEDIEQNIIKNKKTEGIYTVSLKILQGIDNILKDKKSFISVLSEIDSLHDVDFSVVSASTDKLGKLSMVVDASSSSALYSLVDLLKSKELEKKVFSDIQAQGITRDKKGAYSLIISLKVDNTLYNE